MKNMNLIKLLLRFAVGRFAVSGDIKQFFNCANLIVQQWNLQRFVFKEGLDPDSETKEGVITTAIYGVTSSNSQTEVIKMKLAGVVKENKPEVAKMLIDSTYVDDVGESMANLDQCMALIADADEAFASIGCKIKDWVVSGQDPSEKVSKDGISIEIGGVIWYPKLDILMVKIPLLHFGKIVRGRIKPGTQFFTGGSLESLDEFFPGRFTKRQSTSKLASIWDPRGKLAPMMAAAKQLLRLTNTQTVGWDDPMPAIIRNKWIQMFWRFEKLRALQFTRPVMPADAKNCKMRLLCGADAAAPMIMVGGWGGFERTDGTWSCQLLLGRSVMADENSTIPKLELEGLCAASNMKWIISRALEDWVDSEAVFGDSRIALCWTTSENKRLGIFHRARVLQIRRGTSLDSLYHVRTDHNPCDTGTRPDKLTINSVGPESRWEKGEKWMSGGFAKAIKADILKPASELRIKLRRRKSSMMDAFLRSRKSW